ncbi:hypothetical protein F2Q69_00059573 [Brassica cretica]|uniref:Uncharacterized protein n=1 Tax=Brassica cretica TaxID=69181 RepID=A0A8S9RNN7_BRACR|nr:hypothetical protein F2Q69_00059573 [Brassica cretica]
MRGSRGLFIDIRSQSDSSRVAARVSLRMAPDACAAAPRAPHGWLHDLLTCKVTPRPLPIWMHGLAPCKETPRPPHVWLHGLVACIATPRAWLIHLVLLTTGHMKTTTNTTPHYPTPNNLQRKVHLIAQFNNISNIGNTQQSSAEQNLLQTLKCSDCVQMRGSRGLFIDIRSQSDSSRVAARVSLRMALDACAAAPRAPHGWLHDLLTCKVTPRPLPIWMHGLAPCKETPRPPHVWLHGLVACIATPRAWLIHLVLHISICMYMFHVLQHLMLPSTHTLLRTCHNVLNIHTSSHLVLLGPFVRFRPLR